MRYFPLFADLAEAHVLALELLGRGGGPAIYNLGCGGDGYTVREVVQVAERVTGRRVPVQKGARRPGDPAVLVAASDRIRRELGWRPRFQSLDEIGDVLIETRDDGVPVRVRDVGRVHLAPLIRQGAVTRDGRGEVVTGIVMMLVGANGREVVENVKAKIAQIAPSLPPGVRIEAFYDRADLVNRTIHTVAKNLEENDSYPYDLDATRDERGQLRFTVVMYRDRQS